MISILMWSPRSRVWHEDHKFLDTCQAVTASTQFLDVNFVLLAFLHGRIVCSITHLILTSFYSGQLQQEEGHAGNHSENDSRSHELPWVITVVAPYKRTKSRRNSVLPLNLLQVLIPSIPSELSRCGNHILLRLEDYVESLWDDTVERLGTGEERKRKKKTRRWISTANAFQSKCFPHWV